MDSGSIRKRRARCLGRHAELDSELASDLELRAHMKLLFNLAHYRTPSGFTIDARQFLLVEELTQQATVGLVWETGPTAAIAQHFERVLKKLVEAAIRRDQAQIDFWDRELCRLVGRSSAERARVRLDDNNYEAFNRLHHGHGFDWPIPETIEWTEPAA